MRNEIREKAAMFKAVNDITLKHEIVIFGSDYTADFPFYELSKKYFLSNAIYNRSIKGLSPDEAEEILDICVTDIKPKKLFLCFDEGSMSGSDFVCSLSHIIRKTKAADSECEIYILHAEYSGNASPERIALLKDISEKTGTTFIDLSKTAVKGYSSIFKRLMPFFRNQPLTIGEAFSMAR